MESILSSAHTWFLESYSQAPYGDLFVHLVEGIKGADRLPVQIGEQTLGPYFPVTVEPYSRCVVVQFKDVRGVFTHPEGFDAKDPGLSLAEGRFLRQANGSAFREFASNTTTAIDDYRGDFLEWTEDQIFQVLVGEPPEVYLDTRAPNLSIERGATWSAS
ncbi:hypothetical protein [Pseudoxanthomonas wuyuanensis]